MKIFLAMITCAILTACSCGSPTEVTMDMSGESSYNESTDKLLSKETSGFIVKDGISIANFDYSLTATHLACYDGKDLAPWYYKSSKFSVSINAVGDGYSLSSKTLYNIYDYFTGGCTKYGSLKVFKNYGELRQVLTNAFNNKGYTFTITDKRYWNYKPIASVKIELITESKYDY